VESSPRGEQTRLRPMLPRTGTYLVGRSRVHNECFRRELGGMITGAPVMESSGIGLALRRCRQPRSAVNSETDATRRQGRTAAATVPVSTGGGFSGSPAVSQ
jgi:hypothetical protein